MNYIPKFLKLDREFYLPLFIIIVFFFAYLTLVLVKHAHYWTGYDLSIENQIVWGFNQLTVPTVTVHAYAFIPIFYDHVEFVYLLIAPFYWILGDARMLLFLQVLAAILSGIPIFLLARKHKINFYLALSLLISYFMFFGVQNALWSDVHSSVFGLSFMAFFIYYLDTNRKWLSVLFFILSLTSKEDMGLLLFFISFIYFIKTRRKINLSFMLASVIYLFLIFFIYYPNFTLGYQYANAEGLISNINLFNFFNTQAKIDVFFYTLNSYGYLPLLNPLMLIPYIADLGHFFVLGNDTATSSHSIFQHYRFSSAILLIWPTIFVIEKFKKLNNKFFSLYILFFTALTTYMLHAPLTYLTKKWFWTKPSGIENIELAIKTLPKDSYVATQTNISPHISNRELIVTIWGDKRTFKEKSPCGKEDCEWFKWAGDPKYLFVDTSPEWNILHLLANREDFIKGLENMEKFGVIKKYKEFGSSTIYTIHKKPY
ncbi:MAG: DUF2079 domain-containing protein [Candidatus Levybacteria bacterium]|nr:DUF2079 domain-containing protein [Candidatus Levybacteria bacterium]